MCGGVLHPALLLWLTPGQDLVMVERPEKSTVLYTVGNANTYSWYVKAA